MLERIASGVGDLAIGQRQLPDRVGGLTERVGGLEQGQTVILEQLQQHGRILARLDGGPAAPEA
jgi:hypothetical protein